MIEFVRGDIFDSKADALVCPVNCKGVMGKGLALEFKLRFWDCSDVYESACRTRSLRPGTLAAISYTPQKIIFFPTKDDWRKPSQLQYIVDGLDFFVRHYEKWNIRSIAFPKLGCGLGGLDWNDVKPLMVEKLSPLDLCVEIYE